MEYVFDCDVVGEILIPLENNFDHKQADNKFSDLSKLTERTYKEFRSILFQGELLRFFLIARIDSPQSGPEFFDNLFVKFEFDPSCDMNSTNINENEGNPSDECNITIPEGDNDPAFLSNDVEKIHVIEPFSLHRNSLFKGNIKSKGASLSNSYKNVNYDIISRRYYNEEKNIIIFEIIRNIVIPNNFLNKSLIMKLNIMRKNKLDHLYDGSYNLLDIFSSGAYNEVKEFTILKTLFKEVKIIRPISISKINQIDILPDCSFLQMKIENITSSINFLDKSLKASRFLKQTQEEEYLTYGINLLIKDIHVLKEETVLDKKSTITSKKLEKLLQDKLCIGLNNFEFQLLNSEIPVEIKPGEELVISIKITKPSLNMNHTVITNKLFPNSIEQKPSNLNTPNTINKALPLTNINTTNQPVGGSYDHRGSISDRGITASASDKNLIRPSIISQNIQHSKTLATLPILNHTVSDNISNTNPLNTYQTLISEGSQANYFDVEEIVKVILSTPLILNIVSYKFYDTLFITVPIKWQNEIYRCFKFELEIQDKIKLHEYFNVTIKLKNMSINIMDIELEISDSSTDFINQQDLFSSINVSHKKGFDDEIPSILSETKNKVIGMINPNEEKVVDIRFLAVKKGFHSLTSFSLIERLSGKKFYFVYTNKIYID